MQTFKQLSEDEIRIYVNEYMNESQHQEIDNNLLVKLFKNHEPTIRLLLNDFLLYVLILNEN